MSDRAARNLIKKALAVHRTTRSAAAALGFSQRTLLRRMRALSIPVAKVGRPQVGPQPIAVFFSNAKEHAELTRQEGRRWRSKSIEERILAVEAIREATAALNGTRLPLRMERVCRYIGEPPREVSAGGRTRSRRSR